jgi:uncharacterized protein (DUF1697 family)
MYYFLPMTKVRKSTKRYAAFLRGVMPFNCKMAELRKAFEKAGFTNVVTVIGSGNVVFDAPPATTRALEAAAEAAMAAHMGRTFLTIIRPVAYLETLLAADPFKGKRVPEGAKRNVTFLKHKPASSIKPGRAPGAVIVGQQGTEAFMYYEPGAATAGPEFMRLIEKTFGTAQTTRTWLTVEKVVQAALR